MNIVLISTYELGRQPFGLASPAAWLRARGHQVTTADLSVAKPPAEAIRNAGLIAFYLPMHTATRLALQLLPRIRGANPAAALCAYGLYAPLAQDRLRELGVSAFFGGEFEAALASYADTLTPPSSCQSFERLQFLKPDRSTLPTPDLYSKLVVGQEKRLAGYAEASRGCKHLCRHCPVVPVYNGTFRVIQPEIVLDDIAAQVAAGAQHISFGDPDFFNGPGHARRIVEQFHRRHPDITYDVTIKIEHLLQHSAFLPVLRDTGCAFVTSAVESVDDTVLLKLDKGHTRADFLRVAELFQQHNLVLAPTFIPFTPWTTRRSYRELLDVVAQTNLIDHVSPVQLTLRLLIPQNSRLLEVDDVQKVITAWDSDALVWRWQHPIPEIDDLAARTLRTLNRIVKSSTDRRTAFAALWQLVEDTPVPVDGSILPRTVIPYMEEPWFC